MLGHIVEAADLTERIAGMLRLMAEVIPPDSDVALAAGWARPTRSWKVR